MKIDVRNNLHMQSLTDENAVEVYSVINKNRNYLRRWLPWVDTTSSSNNITNTIKS